MHQSGLLDHVLRVAGQQANKNPCAINKIYGKKNDEKIAMKLQDFSGAFFIVGVGIGCAFFTLMGEFILEWAFKKTHCVTQK